MLNTSAINKLLGGIDSDNGLSPVTMGERAPIYRPVQTSLVAKPIVNSPVPDTPIYKPVTAAPPPVAAPVANKVVTAVTGVKPVAVPVTKPAPSVQTVTSPTVVKTAVKTVAVIDTPKPTTTKPTTTKTPTPVATTTKTPTWNDNTTNTTGVNVTVSYRNIKGKGWVLAAIIVALIAIKRAIFN